MSIKEKSYKTPLLKLQNIASWWLSEIENTTKKDTGQEIKAALPSLQRGWVWNNKQVIYLWDSIARGFPIGAISLAPINKNNNIIKDAKIVNPTHLLLDGQQRATSISLGFDDIWSKKITTKKLEELTEALWIDIAPERDKSGRQFYFFLVTKSHPWGYQNENPENKLSARDVRDALAAFRHINGDKKTLPHDLKINAVFPWNANAPIPVALLIEAIKANNSKFLEADDNDDKIYNTVSDKLLKLIKNTTIWKEISKLGDAQEEGALKSAYEKLLNVENILKDENNAEFKKIIRSINNALLTLEIPASILQHINFNDQTSDSSEDDDENNENDPLFTLFDRINTGGTTPTAEEINYSFLKSIWPEAQEVIEQKL